MAIRIVRLGSPRQRGEGPRLGTVRRPPRGVPKAEFAKRDFYDAWLPVLSPSPELVATAQAAESDKDWRAFVRHFRAEMKAPEARQVLELLALMSQESNFSLGCYCEREERCHRSVLRELLQDLGAKIVS